MALNPKMILASDLQQYFVDKTTGEQLSAGVINFYSEPDEVTHKAVYQMTGSVMTGFTYSPLPNPVILSAVGTMQDALGNDIVAYYYPYVGDPATDSDVVELYYITVDSSDGVRQFDRHNWPYPDSAGGSTIGQSNLINFIPSGQFLAHTDNSFQTAEPVAINNLNIKNIAWGGWTMEDQVASGGVYTSIFTPVSAGSAFLNDFPPYFLDYASTSPTSGIHQIGVKWRDVNQFEAADTHANIGATPYTLFFYAQSNDGGTYAFELRRIKYFGTGGSATLDDYIADVTFEPNPTNVYQTKPVTFGNNIGKTVGAGSYVQLVLRPKNVGSFNVRVTDFVLAVGNVAIQSFPPMTNAQMLSQAVAGWMQPPLPDASDLYLPLVLSANGMVFDHSSIGSIVAKMTTSPVNNELLCDGTAYKASDFSSLGIPYARLRDALFNSTNNAPLFGTGANWVNTYQVSGVPNTLLLATNQASAQTFPSDGGVATGFTFLANSHNVGSGAIYYNAYSNGNNGSVLAISVFTNAAAASANAGTSGMAVFDYNEATTGGMQYAFGVIPLAAGTLSTGAGIAGKWFEYATNASVYRAWFNVVGEIAPASDGHVLQQINLVPGMSAIDVGIVIANVIGQYQTAAITITGQPTGGAGSYFTFYSNSTPTAVWYKIAGVGTAPAVSSLVQVDLDGTETAAQVQTKTQIAMNKAYFAVPDLRGLFLRGAETSTSAPNYDWGVAYRASSWNLGLVLQPGSIEWQGFQIHKHPGSTVVAGVGVGTDGFGENHGTSTHPVTITQEGIAETRPSNMYVYYYIKY